MKQRMIGILTLFFLLLFACTHSLDSEEKKQVEALHTELEGVHKEVAVAQTELSKYTGGLIQGMLQVRIEMGAALLRQAKNS